LLREQDFPRPFNESPVNKGFGPVDSLWTRRQIWLRQLALFAIVWKKISRQGAEDAKRALLPTQNRTTCSLCALAALREKGFSCSWIGYRPGTGRLSMELRRGLVAASPRYVLCASARDFVFCVGSANCRR
jgi:hypothetical protein